MSSSMGHSITVLSISALMAGCTIVGHEQVLGWPELRVAEHHVPHHVMRDKCAKYAPFGMSPEACMEFNLQAGTCDIWYSAEFPPSKAVMEHERLHCRGYDHVGGSVLKNAVAAWKEYVSGASTSAAATALRQNSRSPELAGRRLDGS